MRKANMKSLISSHLAQKERACKFPYFPASYRLSVLTLGKKCHYQRRLHDLHFSVSFYITHRDRARRFYRTNSHVPPLICRSLFFYHRGGMERGFIWSNVFIGPRPSIS